MPVPLTLAEVAFALTAITLGALVQASVGLGVALIAAPFLLIIDRAFIPGPLLMVALVLTLLIAIRDRRAIDTKGLKFALVGRVIGTVPAALTVTVLADNLFDLVFGGLVIFAVFLSLLGLRFAATASTTLIAGAMSGFMGTLASIGGPPMALIYQDAKGARLRGTLSSFFVFGSSLSIATLFAVGGIGPTEIMLAVVLLPGVIIGFVFSKWTLGIVDRGKVRPFILSLSFATGVVVVVRALG